MHDFDTIIEQFRKKELNIEDWHWCTYSEGNGVFGAYIMGEGSEQCLACKHAFGTKQEVIDFYKSLGVNEKWILPI
jgi:hypothetical protein